MYIGPLKVIYKGMTYWNIQYKGRSITSQQTTLKSLMTCPCNYSLMAIIMSTDADHAPHSEEEDEASVLQYSTGESQLQISSSDQEPSGSSEDDLLSDATLFPYAEVLNFPRESCPLSDHCTSSEECITRARNYAQTQ